MLNDTSPLCCPSSTVVADVPLKEHGGDLAGKGDLVRTEGASGRRNGLGGHKAGGGLWDFAGEKVLWAGGGDMEESAVAMERN